MPRLAPVTRVTGWSTGFSSTCSAAQAAERHAGADVIECGLHVNNDRTGVAERLRHNARRLGDRRYGQPLGAEALCPEREIGIAERRGVDSARVGPLLVQADG